GKRDRAVLAILLGCGLRRAEVVELKISDLQLREDHWVIADLIGKGRHIRTVPMPTWVKAAIDEWTTAAKITEGRLFRRINKNGDVWGDGITPKAVWHIVKKAAKTADLNVAPHYLRRT